MIFSLAPMEGLTGHVFRRVHAERFGALDRYYTPFLAAPRVGCGFRKRDRPEVDPERNRGLNVVPQLLTKDADEFLWAAGLLAQMGYGEVNLNLGCPSGTVASKGKGSGFLGNLEELDAFLARVCDESPLPVSVKTRIGVEDDGEYRAILDVYCRHPLAELVVHPRVRRDAYRGRARREAYAATLERAPFPVAYNGDLFRPSDVDALVAACPGTRHLMLGRGLVANPALVRVLRGGEALDRAELEEFHRGLYDAYAEIMGGNAVARMKEWWAYAACAFADPASVRRAVRKARRQDEYEAAAARVFATEELAADPYYRP